MKLIDKVNEIFAKKEALRKRVEEQDRQVEAELEAIDKELIETLGFSEKSPLTLQAIIQIVDKVSKES